MTGTYLTRADVFAFISQRMTSPITSRTASCAANHAIHSMLSTAVRTGEQLTITATGYPPAVVTGRKVRDGFLRSHEEFTVRTPCMCQDRCTPDMHS